VKLYLFDHHITTFFTKFTFSIFSNRQEEA